ncbi:hypothetical protein JW872_02245 [Candidatus Babeliales bacterium]|nr:hypothetical protein [Candidatus Babeliales bacterium]
MGIVSNEHRLRVIEVLQTLEKATRDMPEPMIFLLKKHFGPDSFIILIGCLLSLRAKDSVTYPLCLELFKIVRTPQQLLSLSREKLEKILYPLGFQRRKAATLHTVCRELLDRFDGNVPCNEKALRSIRGIGHKTTALVLAEACDTPAICVDTHVHRLANQLGLVQTKSTEATEQELKKLVPQEKWVVVNRVFVTWGQQVPRKEQISKIIELLNEKNVPCDS